MIISLYYISDYFGKRMIEHKDYNAIIFSERSETPSLREILLEKEKNINNSQKDDYEQEQIFKYENS